MFSSISGLVHLFFADNFGSDDRKPFLVVDLSKTWWLSRWQNASLAFYSFDPNFWCRSFCLLVFQSIVNCIFAIVVYYGIIIPQQRHEQQEHRNRQQQIWPTYFLLGYGVVIPLLLILPFWLIDWFDLHNAALILCVGGSNPAMLVFRCLEAMHGTLPSYLTSHSSSFPTHSPLHQENPSNGANGSPKSKIQDKESLNTSSSSLTQFVMYYASSIQFELDPIKGTPIPFNTRQQVIQKLRKFALLFVQTSLCYSLLLSFNYQVFPSSKVENPLYLLYWGNLLNNFLMASLTSLCLESGACGLGLMISGVTGIATMDFSDSPLTKSSSPSDFWGCRWNQLTGPALRRGVYQPLRKCWKLNSHIAVCVTFIASGILHEYVLNVLSQRRGLLPNTVTYSFSRDGHAQQVFVPNYGNHLLFFGWCSLTLLGERFLGERLAKSFPIKGFFRTLLVLMTSLPLAHLFTDEYVAIKFYDDISLGFPKLILKLDGILKQ